MKFLYFLIFVSFFISLQAEGRVYRHSSMFKDATWKVSAINHNYFDKSGSQILFISKFYGALQHSFFPTIDFNAEYTIQTSQGATQSTYERNTRNEHISPSYIYISIQPISSERLYLKAGAFNQEFLDAPLLVTNWSFLAFQQEYFLYHKVLYKYVDNFKIVLQQSVPSSNTDLDFLQQVQNIAQFYTASIFAESFIKNQIQSSATLSLFMFRNLSAEVADFGRAYGNDVKADYHGADSELRFPQAGLYMRGRARYNVFPELGLESIVSFLWNAAATWEAMNDNFEDPARSLGASLFLGFHIPIDKNIIFIPSIEIFSNDNNAAPAFYNSPDYVHSGRYGVIVGAKANFEAYNVFFEFKFGTIRSNNSTISSIGHPNYLTFEIGTHYEKI